MRIGFFLIICCSVTVLGLASSISNQVASTNTVIPKIIPWSPPAVDTKPLAEQYAKCTNGHEKLHFCISLIDQWVIDRGVDLEVVKQIFGKDFIDCGEGREGLCARVDFGVLHKSKVPDGQSWIEGWYLDLQYTKSRKIKSFSLKTWEK